MDCIPVSTFMFGACHPGQLVSVVLRYAVIIRRMRAARVEHRTQNSELRHDLFNSKMYKEGFKNGLSRSKTTIYIILIGIVIHINA